jgi:hypothetical protein
MRIVFPDAQFRHGQHLRPDDGAARYEVAVAVAVGGGMDVPADAVW